VASAQAIIGAVRQAFPAKMALGNKMLAQHTLTVFGRLNARPPSPLATISLLVLHGGAFLAAILVAIVLIVGERGDLRKFVAAAARRPQHTFQPGDVQAWPVGGQQDPAAMRDLVVTTLKNRAAAGNAFGELTNRVSAGCGLTRLGDSLVVSLPTGDETSRDRWFDELQARSTNTFVVLSNAPVSVSMAFIAPTDAASTNLVLELLDYFTMSREMHLLAPWSPEARRPDFVVWSRARQGWRTIGEEIAKAANDPALEPYAAKMAAAMRRGARAEMERLSKEREKQAQEIEARARERLRTESPSRIDPALLDLYARVNSPDLTNHVARRAVLRELAGKLGEVAYAGDKPAPGAEACGASSGIVAGRGLLLKALMINFYDPTQGLPAMAEWLQGLGCKDIRYQMNGSGWASDMDEEDN
jgi:hypothetical protein